MNLLASILDSLDLKAQYYLQLNKQQIPLKSLFLISYQVLFKININIERQMSSLTASSKLIEIQENNLGTVVLKNIKTGLNSPHLPILFKVKTNLKDKVDVRPSFGVLLPNSIDRSTLNLIIKYSGQPQQIEKTKLMISWIVIQNKKELEEKISHQEFTDIFGKAIKLSEGSLILPFKLKEKAYLDRFIVNNSDQNLSNIDSNIDRNSDSFPPITDQKKIQKEKQKQNFQSINKPSEEIQQKQIEIKQIKIVKQGGFSLKLLLIVFILAFCIGFYAGTKIQEIKQHLNLPSTQNYTITQQQKPISNKQNEIQSNSDAPNNQQDANSQRISQATQEKQSEQNKQNQEQQTISESKRQQNL